MLQKYLENKINNWCPLLVLIFCLLLIYGSFSFAFANNDQLSAYEQNEILVKLKNDSTIYIFRFNQKINLQEVISDYQKNPWVEYVEPNYTFQIVAFPNDPYYSKQDYLKKVSAKDGWSKELLAKQLSGQNPEVVIAVIDTGVDTDHPDLKDNIWVNTDEIAGNNKDDDKNGYIDDVNGWNFVENIADPNPKFEFFYTEGGINHGTIIAGIAAARGHNNEGITGVSWKAKIMSLRALDSQGRGNVYNVQQAIDYAIKNGADIINMSFVGFDYSQILYEKIKEAYESEVVIVAAAGNTDPSLQGVNLDETKTYPVCYGDSKEKNLVIGVASIDADNKKSSFSNYGINCIDISAPGESFFSTLVYDTKYFSFDKYYGGYWSGTSVSAPLVAGTVAIIKSLDDKLASQEIIDLIIKNTDSIDSYNSDYQGKLGSGRLNIYKSIVATLGYKKEEGEEEGEVSVGENYIVSGLGFGSIPQVKIYNLSENLIRTFYAYSVNFNGAINIATGDIDNDGQDEIITGAGPGGGPHVRVFDKYGNLKSQFFAYNSAFRGGVYVTTGDVNRDGQDEIITGAGPGGGPHVRVFDIKGKILSEFFAYVPGFRGGVNVATGDIDNDGQDEIITGAGPGGGPHVRVFDRYGNVKLQFFAYNAIFRGGVKVAGGDVNGDGLDEIITAVAQDGVPSVKVYQELRLLYKFFAYEGNFFKGVNISTGDIDDDGKEEIITGTGIGGSPQVRIFDYYGRLEAQFFTHSSTYQGGVRPTMIRY